MHNDEYLWATAEDIEGYVLVLAHERKHAAFQKLLGAIGSREDALAIEDAIRETLLQHDFVDMIKRKTNTA